LNISTPFCPQPSWDAFFRQAAWDGIFCQQLAGRVWVKPWGRYLTHHGYGAVNIGLVYKHHMRVEASFLQLSMTWFCAL